MVIRDLHISIGVSQIRGLVLHVRVDDMGSLTPSDIFLVVFGIAHAKSQMVPVKYNDGLQLGPPNFMA